MLARKANISIRVNPQKALPIRLDGIELLNSIRNSTDMTNPISGVYLIYGWGGTVTLVVNNKLIVTR